MKEPLLGLRQFLEGEIPLKMMKNTFHFMLREGYTVIFFFQGIS